MDVHRLPLDFESRRQHLTSWFIERAMPFWGTHGTDWAHGGFFERFDLGGQPLDEPRRTRVVARQIYVVTQAKALGWTGPSDALLAHGLSFLLSKLQQSDHTFASAVKVDGTVANANFDLYEQAFALFALARASQALTDAAAQTRLQDTANRTRQALVARFKHPVFGFEESEPPSSPLKSNPHMHLLEATLAWEQAAPNAADALPWRALSDEIAELALQRLIDPATGALSECFDAHWQRLSGAAGDVVEPGHQFEWAWLLMRWGHERQRTDAIQAAGRLIDIGESHGTCTQRGVALNQINHATQVVDAGAKLWPQTERVKAWCALAQHARSDAERAQALQGANRAMQGLMPYLNHPNPGLWQEVMRPDGEFTVEPCRASSLYHIVCAIETLHQTSV